MVGAKTVRRFLQEATHASFLEVALHLCSWLARHLHAPWVEVLERRQGAWRRLAGHGLPYPHHCPEDPSLATLTGLRHPAATSPPQWTADLGAKVGLAAPVWAEEGPWGLVLAYRRLPFRRAHQETMALAALMLSMARQLQGARARLDVILQNPHHLVCELDGKGRVVWLSEAFFGPLGALRQLLLGQPVTRLLHPEDLPRVLAAMEGRWGKVSFRWWHLRGEWIWLDGVGGRFLTPEGDLRGLVLLRDITAHKELEKALAADKEERETILQTLREGIVVLDLGLTVTWANRAMESLTGRQRQQLEGEAIESLLAPGQGGHLREAVFRCLGEGEEMVCAEVELQTVEGALIPAEVTIRPVRHGSRPTALVASFLDLRERRQQEQRLREQQQFLESLLNSLTDGVYLVNKERRIIWANEAFERMTGYSRQELVGMSIASIIAPEHDALAQEMRRRKERGEAQVTRYEVELVTRDGRRLPVEIHSTLLHGCEMEGIAVAIARDIGERKYWEERLTYMADHDPLTGLFNRRRLLEELEREIDRVARYGGRDAFLWLDMDNFKDINDTYGHTVGDLVLQETARVLRQSVRRTDVVGRLGGDEFGILLINADEKRAREVAHRLRAQLERVTVPEVGGLHISASIGIAMVEGGGLSVQDVLVRADRAMYHAKKGHNGQGISVWGKETPTRPIGAHWVRHVLDRGLLRLYCQPILHLPSGRIERYELLLRIVEGDQAFPPEPFIREAEREGLIWEVDRWVIGEAARLLRRLRSQAPHMAVHIDLHINLSAQSLLSERLLDAIRAEMQGLPSWEGRLVLELTETSPLGDLEEERRRMLQLKALGCRLVMDDFGVGYSTCHRLLHLPLDMVKLDGSLVRGLGSLEAQRVVVASMVQAVKALGLLVVAEQVEDQETLEALRLLGVDYAQGYHIGRPRPVEEEWPGP